MQYDYTVIDPSGKKKNGQIEVLNKDIAISSLQKRGFVVVSVNESGKRKGLKQNISFFDSVNPKDVVIMSRQISALFEAQVSAVEAFLLLAESADNATIKRTLQSVAQDIQGGISISSSMAKYPKVFSDFYVNMVRAGEESGKLVETFLYLADYLDRQYELLSKTRNALIYPAFVIVSFVVVMILMMTMVIPRLSAIIIESGQQIPIYTRVVIGISNFFVNYGIILLVLVILLSVYLWRLAQTEKGKRRIDYTKIKIPYIGVLFQKLYLSRIADNLTTMISAGIPIVRALEITGAVVDNKIYEDIMRDAVNDVKGGTAISESLRKHPDAIPPIMVQMVKVGEESGKLGSILDTVARFYKREVNAAIDTLIGLIEPAMIVFLGLGVGFLLTAILIPIYNIAGSI